MGELLQRLLAPQTGHPCTGMHDVDGDHLSYSDEGFLRSLRCHGIRTPPNQSRDIVFVWAHLVHHQSENWIFIRGGVLRMVAPLKEEIMRTSLLVSAITLASACGGYQPPVEVQSLSGA